MARLGLSAPWITYYHELVAFFEQDHGVRIVLDEGNCEIKIYADYAQKEVALSELLPKEIEFGSVTLKVTVVPVNSKTAKTMAHITALSKPELIGIVLSDNDALVYTQMIDGVFTNPITYFVFENSVVQYFNDSLSDIHGLCSTLYENLARNIFGNDEGVFFCTDLPEN